MRYRLCLVAIILLLMINTASASLRLHVEGDSYPNPSIEGQEVTYTIYVYYQDTETGKITPVNVGNCGWFHPLSGTNERVINGEASIKRSDVPIGDYNIEIIYWWTPETIWDVYGSFHHSVLKYAPVDVTTDDSNPMTVTANFDFAETDDPTFIKPTVKCYMEVYKDDSSHYDTGGYIQVPESGIFSWTTPELTPGIYDICVECYTTQSNGVRSSYDSIRFTKDVGGSGSVDVPEYPSILFPIVVILGLITVFGRTKK